MPVELWFPVPFMIHAVDAAVRDATRAKVLKHLEAGGERAAGSILQEADLVEFKEMVLATGTSFLQGMGVAPVRLEFERARLSVFQPGAQEAQHSHDGSLLSGYYYVEAPENCGDLVFPDPVASRRAHRAFTNTMGTTFFIMPDCGLRPQAGNMILFESWVQHSVQCNKSDQPRISLAFDLRRAD